MPVRRSARPPFSQIAEARWSRRTLLASITGAAAACLAPQHRGTRPATFASVSNEVSQRHALPEGYRMDVVASWGDALFTDKGPLDPRRPDSTTQRHAFGFHNDYLAFFPLPGWNHRFDDPHRRGLLAVNHEYPDGRMMFAGHLGDTYTGSIDAEQIRIEMLAVGHTIIEVEQTDRGWQVVRDSRFNRRINALETQTRLTGPAAGHSRMQTREDPDGHHPTGILNLCGGGQTPWGTVLVCEENFQDYFRGASDDPIESPRHTRYGVGSHNGFHWHTVARRFDLSHEPREPNRFGWVVEIDPYDPTCTPKKRTALGRFAHESAQTVVASDGRVVVFMGDDDRFEYLYRFVTKHRWNEHDPDHNKNLLNSGTLSVARFHDDGTVTWLPLVFGEGPLTPQNGFRDQGDVVIDARLAADLVGATPMDRPEGVTASAKSGRVYAAFTNNTLRQVDGTQGINAANPRPNNAHGHVLELRPAGRDPLALGADAFTWDFLFLAGPPTLDAGSWYGSRDPGDAWMSCPDNVVIDPFDRLWVATDGAPKASGTADGLFLVHTDGVRRGEPKRFFRAPDVAEVTGPAFTPDGRTLFLSVQHPGELSSVDAPSTRWPRFEPDMPPLSSVVAIYRTDGLLFGDG